MKMKSKEEIQQLAKLKHSYEHGIETNVTDDLRQCFIETYTQCQEDIIKEIDNLKSQAKEPKYAVKGDYCAVCRGTEFWNDEEE